MTGPGDVPRLGRRSRPATPDGVRAVGGADAGADAVGASTVTVYAVRSPVWLSPASSAAAPAGPDGRRHRHADDARGVADRERHQLGRRRAAAKMRSPSFSRSSSSTTTTALPARDVGEGVLDAVQPEPCRAGSSGRVLLPGWFLRLGASRRSTYLAMTSTSRLTGSPTFLAPRVVRASVSGISETVNVLRVVDLDDGERDAVDGDRALGHEVAARSGGTLTGTTSQC